MRYAYNISLVAALLLLAQLAYSQIAITGIQHSVKPEDFKDLCLGSIDLTAEGTAEPFTYQWSNGATTQDIQKLCIGLYTVTVTNRFGCSWVLESYINNCENSFPPLELKDYKVTPISAAGAKDGAINLVVQGGAGETYYKWIKDGESGVFASTKDLSNLSAGKYCVTISGGCRGPIEKCFTITSCSSVSWDIKGAVKNECDCSTCQDCRKGSIKLSIAKPLGDEKTYQWSNGATVSEIKDLVAGTYTVTVLDRLTGCTGTQSFSIKKVPVGPEELLGNCLVERKCEGDGVCKRSLGQSNLRYEFGTCNYPHINGAQCIRWQYCGDTRIEGTCVYTGNPKKEYNWNACKGKLVCSDFVVEEQQGKITYKDQECGRTETCTITWNDGTKESKIIKTGESYIQCRIQCDAFTGGGLPDAECCMVVGYCEDTPNEQKTLNKYYDPSDGFKNCKTLPSCPPGLWDPNYDRSLQTGKVGSLVLQTNPNPFYDILVFSYGQAQIGSELDIVLLNAVGAVVFTQKAVCENVEGNIIIQFGGLLPSGVYRLLVKGGGHEFFYQKNLVHINR